MNRALAGLALLAAAAALPAAPAAYAEEPAPERKVVARVDPRVEILSIVFRLAGNPEYSQGKVDSYVKAVEERFGKLRDHAVVRRAAALRRARGVSFDAVMGYAVHLDDSLRLPADPAATSRLDPRWPADEAAKFAEELRDFAKQADAAGFFEARRGLYELTAKRMQERIDRDVKMEWFDAYFGARPAARFELTLGLLNGGGCYGPSVLRTDGSEVLHCVLGVWQTDAEGAPVFPPDVVPTVVHEFCHSYCNALVDARIEALLPPGESLWPHVADAMRAQAYAEPRTMLRESLVRACVVRYRAANEGAEAARREIEEQHGLSFPWTGGLSEVLSSYEKERAEHPTLATFMPRVAKFLEEYAARFAAEVKAAPTVASMVPRNGAKDVDPGLKAIVVTFDRPMRDRAWAVVGGGPNFPKLKGAPSYDESRKVLTIPVELQPSWSYEFWLNRGKYDSFRSADGVKLMPLHVTFTTRAE